MLQLFTLRGVPPHPQGWFSRYVARLVRAADTTPEEVAVGKFIYGTAANSFEIDDRTLAHLRIVIMNKLRRSESFMFDVAMNDGSGHRSFWINPGVAIQFQFFGSRAPRINRAWVEELMAAASGPEISPTRSPASGRSSRRSGDDAGTPQARDRDRETARRRRAASTAGRAPQQHAAGDADRGARSAGTRVSRRGSRVGLRVRDAATSGWARRRRRASSRRS